MCGGASLGLPADVAMRLWPDIDTSGWPPLPETQSGSDSATEAEKERDSTDPDDNN